MPQPAKLIGLQYQDKIHYAMFINVRNFKSPTEVQMLTEQAGISTYQAYKYLLIAPLRELGQGGEIIFSNMPGKLVPRDPYILSFDFLRDRWDDIQSGTIINVDLVIKHGLSGWNGDIADYIVSL